MRLRAGPHRQAHFYHLRSSKGCRQHQKTLEHLNAQVRLLSLLPEREGSMERPFPEIERIADVAWIERGVVFEIQYSPISLEEAMQRTVDYKKVGFEVIWVLHEKRFNQKMLSSAEKYLREGNCFFTDIDARSEGTFYDQFEILKGHKRLFRGPKLPVQLNVLLPLDSSRLPELASSPKAIQLRYAGWTLYAKGDLFDHFQKKGAGKSMLPLEARYHSEKKAKVLPLWAIVLRYYALCIDFLLKI